jgi:hypothetical protein
MEGIGGALSTSVEVIKMLYETGKLYRRLHIINRAYLNEICLLLTLQNHIANSKRSANNDAVMNYMDSISIKLKRLQKKMEAVDGKNRIARFFYCRNINKLAGEIAELVKQMKFLLEVKKELDSSSKLDIANIIACHEGRKFWEANFGSDNLFVQQNIFFGGLRLNTNLLSFEIDFLKKVINDDQDEYISAFEFQEWLDFFGDFTVVMRRTIDSLLDPSNMDIVSWYHKQINKSLIIPIVNETKYLIRKHTIQKGVFIANFYYSDILVDIFIRNKNNQYQIDRVDNMSPMELEIYGVLSKKTYNNLKEITMAILELAEPELAKKHEENQHWSDERVKLVDKEVISMAEPLLSKDEQSNSRLEELAMPFNHLKDGLKSGFQNVSSGVNGIFCCGGRRKM